MEKKDFFQPIKRKCVHEEVCSSFPVRCNDCRFNPNLKINQKTQENQNQNLQPQNRGFGELKEDLAKRYEAMPANFKLF